MPSVLAVTGAIAAEQARERLVELPRVALGVDDVAAGTEGAAGDGDDQAFGGAAQASRQRLAAADGGEPADGAGDVDDRPPSSAVPKSPVAALPATATVDAEPYRARSA